MPCSSSPSVLSSRSGGGRRAHHAARRRPRPPAGWPRAPRVRGRRRRRRLRLPRLEPTPSKHVALANPGATRRSFPKSKRSARRRRRPRAHLGRQRRVAPAAARRHHRQRAAEQRGRLRVERGAVVGALSAQTAAAPPSTAASTGASRHDSARGCSPVARRRRRPVGRRRRGRPHAWTATRRSGRRQRRTLVERSRAPFADASSAQASARRRWSGAHAKGVRFTLRRWQPAAEAEEGLGARRRAVAVAAQRRHASSRPRARRFSPSRNARS